MLVSIQNITHVGWDGASNEVFDFFTSSGKSLLIPINGEGITSYICSQKSKDDIYFLTGPDVLGPKEREESIILMCIYCCHDCQVPNYHYDEHICKEEAPFEKTKHLL